MGMGTNIAKYCMTAEGKFVIFNKNCGMDHQAISLLLEHEPISAGFVVEIDDELVTYGQSISLKIKIREQDMQIINDTLDGGYMRLTYDDVCGHYYAGNIDHIDQGEVTDLVGMQEKGIV